MSSNYVRLQSLGYGQDTTISAASALPALPSSAQGTMALIQAGTADLRWRDDGTDPTTSAGMILASGESFLYTGNPGAVKVISATGEVNVTYYRRP